MNHPNWRLRFDRLDDGEDVGGWEGLLDDLADDVGDRCDFDDALRRTYLHRTRAALREAHVTARARLLDALRPPGEERENEPPENIRPKGLKTMITRKSFIITAAAAAVVFLATTLWLGSGSRFDSQAAFAQMIENVRRANSVSFTEAEQVLTNVQSTTKQVYVASPPRMRIETATEGLGVGLEITYVFDGLRTYTISGPPFKTISISKMRPPDQVFQAAQQIVETLRAYTKDKSAEYLGDREVDGMTCHVYRYLLMEDKPETPYNDWCMFEIYLSAASLYPTKILQLGYTVDTPRSEQKEPVVRKTTYDFKWDFELDPALFEVKVPEGWSVVELPDGAKPQDLFPKLDPEAHQQEIPPEPEE